MTASLAPLIATLRDIEARLGDAPVHGLAPGLIVTDPTGWTRADDLTAGGPALTHLLDAAQRRWKAQPHAAAALAWKCYTYWLALPALVGYAAARRVPLPRAQNILVRYSDHQPFLAMALRRPAVAVLASDPIAGVGDPRVVVCDDDAALLVALRRALIDEHLDLLMTGIRARVHLGRRTLWGSLASGAAHALARAAGSIWPEWSRLTAGSAVGATGEPGAVGATGKPGAVGATGKPGPILATIDEVLRALDVADLVDVQADPQTGALSIQRRTCCLAFTLPEPRICSGCCIR